MAIQWSQQLSGVLYISDIYNNKRSRIIFRRFQFFCSLIIMFVKGNKIHIHERRSFKNINRSNTPTMNKKKALM